jgi:hypothetical protein
MPDAKLAANRWCPPEPATLLIIDVEFDREQRVKNKHMTDRKTGHRE